MVGPAPPGSTGLGGGSQRPFSLSKQIGKQAFPENQTAQPKKAPIS